MNISKHDALQWFEFFAELDEGEGLPPRQQELALATLYQIEEAENARLEALMAEVPQQLVRQASAIAQKILRELILQ